MRANSCQICDQLGPGDLTELDLMMGDASRWPATVWGIFSPPKGRINPLRQRFGAIQMAKLWLAEKGLSDQFSDKVIRSHYRYDVVVIAASVEDLLNRGIIAAADQRRSGLPDGEKIDAVAFLRYFSRGIQLGNRGLELMAERIEAMVAKKEDIPWAVMKMMVETGGKLATTQAMLRARGLNLGDDPDEDEGFRAGSQPLPSERIGHHRIRRIEGESRPVADEGPADREHFSERSRQEGGTGLPHP